MKEIFKSKRTKVAMLSLVAVLICSTGLATLALLASKTDTLTNTFELGDVTTEIKEDVFEPTEVATVFKKEPYVKNIGDNDCYVRVRVTVSPEDQLDINWNTTDWTYKDGYYYYNKILKADTNESGTNGESTSPIFTTVSVKPEYVDTIEGFEVTVYQEAVQCEMKAANGSNTRDMMTIWAAYESNTIPSSF